RAWAWKRIASGMRGESGKFFTKSPKSSSARSQTVVLKARSAALNAALSPGLAARSCDTADSSESKNRTYGRTLRIKDYDSLTEAKIRQIVILHDILLRLEAQFSGAVCLRFAASFDKIGE